MNYEIYTFTSDKKTVYNQTIDIFNKIKPLIHKTLRTWIFIRDIDNNYSEFARGRKCIFDDCGLTKDTHFIASTCVGEQDQKKPLIRVKILVLDNFKDYNIEYMSNIMVMPHTHTYGITFERGVKINTPNNNYYIVSGTASIDKYGYISYVGDLEGQIKHSLFNINELLIKYNSNLNRVVSSTVYVRNLEDIERIKVYLKKYHEYMPVIIRHAHICRPKWLVEVECIVV